MIDETALWATDSLLDDLAAGLPVAHEPGLALLAALVADVSADLPTVTPLPEVARGRRSRLVRLAPRTGVALAAAVAVVSTGGVAAASVNAGPTSPLFPLHQVLTGQPQLDGSQRQALEVRDKLRSATRALAAGKVERAQKDVAAAAGRIAKVAERDGRLGLTAQWKMVNKQVKARAVAPVAVPAKPTETTLPSPLPAHTPTASPKPVAPHTTPARTTLAPRPVTSTTQPPTSSVPTTPSTLPAPVAPTTSPVPSESPTVAPPPSGGTPSVTGSPAPTDSPSPSHHKGKGTTPPPTAAPGSPVDPIVITPTPSASPDPADDSPPPPSEAPASSGPGQAGSVPTSSDSPPASSTPSANPLA